MTFAPSVLKKESKTEPATVFYPVKRRESCTDKTLNEIDPFLFELLDMLAVRRRDKTQTEISFCNEYMKGITKNDGKFVKFNTLKDPKDGNVLAYYYKATNEPVLWSSHVDSVHSGAGYVKVAFDANMQVAFVEDSSTPLGADDAAGMWLLFQMIRAGIGGTFIFHKAEEVGGVGSRGIAKHHQGFLSKFDYAIAFDRKANTSVITHQGGSRCCSDAFADSIIKVLNKQPTMNYKKDDGGIFTDTKNYIDYIAECTNLSCGYLHEHTPNETLDVEFLISLKNALIASFIGGFSHLKKARKPGEKESKYGNSTKKYNHQSAVAKPPSKSPRRSLSRYSEIGDSYYTEDDDLLYESRQQYYLAYGNTDTAEIPDFLDKIIDKQEIETVYFNMHDLTAIELDTLEDSILDDKKYQEYDDDITDEISKMSRMSKDKLKEFLLKIDGGTLCSIVKKLICESGY